MMTMIVLGDGGTASGHELCGPEEIEASDVIEMYSYMY